jgi:hypothetical protein
MCRRGKSVRKPSYRPHGTLRHGMENERVAPACAPQRAWSTDMASRQRPLTEKSRPVAPIVDVSELGAPRSALGAPLSGRRLALGSSRLLYPCAPLHQVLSEGRQHDQPGRGGDGWNVCAGRGRYPFLASRLPNPCRHQTATPPGPEVSQSSGAAGARGYSVSSSERSRPHVTRCHCSHRGSHRGRTGRAHVPGRCPRELKQGISLSLFSDACDKTNPPRNISPCCRVSS